MPLGLENIEDALAIAILRGDVIEAKHIIVIGQPYDIIEWCMRREYVLAAYAGQKEILEWIELTWQEALVIKVKEMKEKENIDENVVLDNMLKYEMQDRMEMVDEARINAYHNNHVNIVRYLEQECGADANTPYSGNVLHEYIMDVIQNENLDLIKVLLGVDLNFANFVDENGETPLMTATHNGSFEIVKYLVSKGADTKILNKQYHSACVIGRLILNEKIEDGHPVDSDLQELQEVVEFLEDVKVTPLEYQL